MFIPIMVIDKTDLKRMTDPKTRRRSVIYFLQIQGKTLSDIAAANGVSRQCIYHAFSVPYPRMEKLVADAVGLTPATLFWERYDSHGLPLSKKGRPPKKSSCQGKKHISANGARRNAQVRAAA